MITKAECYERQQQSASLYRSMKESGNAEDVANAEAYRLASQQWAEVAAAMPGVERGGSASNMLQSREVWDAQSHIDSLMERWRKYLDTGKGHDDVGMMMLNNQQTFIKDDRVRRRMAILQSEAMKQRKDMSLIDARIVALDEWDKGKAAWVKEAKQAIHPATQKGGEIPLDDPRRFVDPNAIVGVLNEFRHVLGLPVPEASRPEPVR